MKKTFSPDKVLIDSIVVEEGRRYQVYPDTGGQDTIGIGHAITEAEAASGYISIKGIKVDYKKGLTHKETDDLCAQDLQIASDAVNKYVKVQLTQNQYNALVSLTFNIGMPAFRKSTLVRLLNTGDFASVPTQMRRWKMDNGVVNPVLRKRREREIVIWFTK
jgi:lysozyme